MRKNTNGRRTQHIKPNPEKGKSDRSIKHKPQVIVYKTNLWDQMKTNS